MILLMGILYSVNSTKARTQITNTHWDGTDSNYTNKDYEKTARTAGQFGSSLFTQYVFACEKYCVGGVIFELLGGILPWFCLPDSPCMLQRHCTVLHHVICKGVVTKCLCDYFSNLSKFISFKNWCCSLDRKLLKRTSACHSFSANLLPVHEQRWPCRRSC